jgi:hypothetical protein
MRLFVTGFAFSAIATALVSAGPPKSEDDSQPPVWTFRVTPGGEPVPALRWHLLPEIREQHEGDAAANYLRALTPEMISRFNTEATSEAIDASNDWPIADLRTEKAKSVRRAVAVSAFAEADRAARCDSCNWRLNQRQREDGIMLLLPEVQSMRILARGLHARTRCRIADGDFPAAMHSLQTEFAAGRHVGLDSPNLIQALVGMSFTSGALRATADWIEAPNSPNLYWALTALPTPFIPVRRGMEGERIFTDVFFPGFRNALYSKTPPPPLDMKKTAEAFKSIGMESNPLIGSFFIAAQADKSRRRLVADGWDPDVVKSLPVTSAVFLYEIAVYDEFLDASLKWMAATPLAAIAGLKEAEAKFVQRSNSAESTILAKLLLPAVQSVYFAQLRLDRHIAGLRCVEAIRLHAAATGSLPKSSAEIKTVPWPHDPTTGKPFEITIDGDAVRIVALPPDGNPKSHGGFEFVVSLAKR